MGIVSSAREAKEGIQGGWAALLGYERLAWHPQMGHVPDLPIYLDSWMLAKNRSYKGLFRDSNEPTWMHAHRVSITVSELEQHNASMAQLLVSQHHDAMEHGLVTLEEVTECLSEHRRVDGDRIRELLQAVSYDGSSYPTKDEAEYWKIQSKIKAMKEFPELVPLFGADAWDNMKDLRRMKGKEQPTSRGPVFEPAYERQMRKLKYSGVLTAAIKPRQPYVAEQIEDLAALHRRIIQLEMDASRSHFVVPVFQS